MDNSLAAKIRELPNTEFALLVAILSVAGLVAFYFIWRNFVRARLIEDTPTARIRSAHQGYLELEGRGRLMEGLPLVAPLTDRPCLWYRYTIEEQNQISDGRGHSTTNWRTVRSGTSDGLFLIDDDTGVCVVDPDGAEVIPTEKQVWYGSDAWPAANPTLTTVGGALFGMGRYRYTEERLLPGPVYALGWFRSVSPVDAPVTAEVSAILRQWKGDTRELLSRFDRNKDGQIDTQEWEIARDAALQAVLQERAERSAQEHVHTLARPPYQRYPFIIAATPQERLARRYKINAGIAAVLFVVFAAAALWALSVR